MMEPNGIYPVQPVRRHEDDCIGCLEPWDCDCECGTCKAARDNMGRKMEKLTKERVNNIGLRYTITEESRHETLVTLGNRAMLMKVSIEIFLASWYKWQVRGDFVQDAFSMLNDNEREFLMTGIDAEQWDTIFQEKEEDEQK